MVAIDISLQLSDLVFPGFTLLMNITLTPSEYQNKIRWNV